MLQLVVGSDKVTSIDEPAVTVSLDTQTQQSGARRYEVEFDSEQLNAFIDQLESVNKVRECTQLYLDSDLNSDSR